MRTSREPGPAANRRRRPLVLLISALLAVTVVAAGCSSSEDDTNSLGELLPFELVADSPFAFEADPNNPGRGIFRVTTTEPMICTIVWGETDEFGNFNNSLAMNGTGIIQHDVVLPGAEAGVEYKFRVQGSTANGDQFRSEMGTFVIPATESGGTDDEMAAHGDNLALSATLVEASSVFGAGWEAENAIDDDLNTEWATSGDGDGGFIVIDLGSAQEVVGVEFLTRSMLDGTATTEQFTLTVDDGETFGPFPAGNPANPGFADAVFTGQILRFDVETSTGGNVGAVEVRAFAPADMDG